MTEKRVKENDSNTILHDPWKFEQLHRTPESQQETTCGSLLGENLPVV
jgi:hypothetical protein